LRYDNDNDIIYNTSSIIDTSNSSYIHSNLSSSDYYSDLLSTTFNTIDIVQFQHYSQCTSYTKMNVLYNIPGIICYFIFILITTYLMLSLVLYHCMIISLGETTNEHVCGVYKHYNNILDRYTNHNNHRSDTTSPNSNQFYGYNPFDYGCCQNWYKCCHSICIHTPSKLPIEFSDYVFRLPS
jgi:hypothetical protein